MDATIRDEAARSGAGETAGPPTRVDAVLVVRAWEPETTACSEVLTSSLAGKLRRLVIVAEGEEHATTAAFSDSRAVCHVRCARGTTVSRMWSLAGDVLSEQGGDAPVFLVSAGTRPAEGDFDRMLTEFAGHPEAGVVGSALALEGVGGPIVCDRLSVSADGWVWLDGPPEAGLDRESLVAVMPQLILLRRDVFRLWCSGPDVSDGWFAVVDRCLMTRDAGWAVASAPVCLSSSAHAPTGPRPPGTDDGLQRMLLVARHWPLRRAVGQAVARFVIDEICGRPWPESRDHRRDVWRMIVTLPGTAWWRARGGVRPRDWWTGLRPSEDLPPTTLAFSALPGATPGPPEPTADLIRVSEAIRNWVSTAPSPIRVVVLGAAPLPFENARMNYAPGKRAWQFATGLTERGMTVVLVCERIPGATIVDGPQSAASRVHDDVLCVWIDDLLDDSENLRLVLDAADPGCVIGASARPSGAAVAGAGDLPVWVDLFGDPMAEAQARELTHPEADNRTAYRDLLARLLERGDAFSTVSERQRWAAVGQLGLLGRLNADTAGETLVRTIPCPVVMAPNAGILPEEPRIGADRWVILWSGGFNTWCDVDTMVSGMEIVLARRPEAVVVTTGAAIRGHDDRTYGAFLERLKRSPHGGRWHVLGCVPPDEVAAWTRRADLGVVTERLLAERELGSSGRVAEWLGAGLPLVMTTISELGATLADGDLAMSYQPGDPESLAAAVLATMDDPEGAHSRAGRALGFALRNWGVAPTTADLAAWARAPRRAQDRDAVNPIALSEVVGNARREDDLARCLAEERDQRVILGRELGEIHTSAMWRCWTVIRFLRSALVALLRLEGRSR